MTNEDRKEVKVESETRTKDISKMIGEGGLGAEKYYDIKKPSPSTESKAEDKKEGKED